MMFLTELELIDLPQPDFWALAAPLVWQAGAQNVTVPAGFKTDLASIPPFLRGLLDVNGRSRRPAALHDWLYHSHLVPRAAADDLLRRALIAEGESRAAARVYWLGVRMGGESAYDAHPHGLTAADFVGNASYQAAIAALPELHVRAAS